MLVDFINETSGNFNPSSFFRRYQKIVMKPEWEAFLLFTLYLSLRWSSKLKEMSTILLSSAVISVIKSLSMKSGNLIYRLHVWNVLCDRKEYEFSDFHRYGFFQHGLGLLSFALFPLQLISALYFVCFDYLVPISQTEDNTIGFVVHEYCRFSDPFIRAMKIHTENSKESVDAISYQSKTPSLFSQLQEAAKESSFIIIFSVVLHRVLLILLFGFFTLFLLLINSMTIAFTISLFFVNLILLLVSFFLGNYIFGLLIVGIKIFSEVLDLNLSEKRYERILCAILIVPGFQLTHYLVLRKLVDCGFAYMKQRKHSGDESVRRAQLFYDIPISVQQAELNLSDLSKLMCNASDSQDYCRLSISFNELAKNVLKVELLDENKDVA